jgi:hypothetical protein
LTAIQNETEETMKLRLGLAILGALMMVPGGSLADDLSGADKLLCTSVQATVCWPEGDCEIGPPWNWNIPQFIEVDLDNKLLSTTAASGENRRTPIKNLERENGNIFLQGFEQGRAFSFVIAEESGRLAVAVARDGITVSVFGACTPI